MPGQRGPCIYPVIQSPTSPVVENGDEIKPSQTPSTVGLEHVLVSGPREAGLLGSGPGILWWHWRMQMTDLHLHKDHLPILFADQIHLKSPVSPVSLQAFKAEFGHMIPSQILSPPTHLLPETFSSFRLHSAKEGLDLALQE